MALCHPDALKSDVRKVSAPACVFTKIDSDHMCLYSDAIGNKTPILRDYAGTAAVSDADSCA
jgi:hypothetical protein